MANVKVEKNRYTVDTLYQWDLNQVLEIYGLSLPATPEIHFTNDTMVRAIRRFATMDAAGVIRVEVPNAMLQATATIKALVCIREGEVFKTYHEIRIPVKARKRPADYTITDEDDIYSFLALENLVYDSVSKMEANNAAAMTAAQQAVSTASNAQEVANAAAATAEGIAETANNASATATAAAETANGVAETANAASATATAAKTAAEDAKAAAEDAKTAAETIEGEIAAKLSMALLWENASPESSFAAQTVEIDLTDFIGVFVYYRNQSGGSVYYSTGFIGKGDSFTLLYVPTTSSSAVVTRKGTVDENGVNFLTTSNETTTYDIPVKIYGVKGVIV